MDSDNDDAKEVFVWNSSVGACFSSFFAASILRRNERSNEDGIKREVLIKIYADIGEINLGTEAILIKQNSLHITIEGEASAMPSLVSSGHSMFHLKGRKATLTLKNLILVHNCEREESKDVGAVVFAMHQAVCTLKNCRLSSVQGFCLWAVQRARFELEGCTITSDLRSGCVGFGDASVRMKNCKISNCFVHGVCVRGNVELVLEDVELHNNGSRALYCYDRPNVSLVRCNVRGTKQSTNGAVELRCMRRKSGVGVGGSSRNPRRIVFSMSHCVVEDNAGPGLRIRGGSRESIDFTCELCRIEGEELFVRDEGEGAGGEEEGDDDVCDEGKTEGVVVKRWSWWYFVDDGEKTCNGWQEYDVETSELLEDRYREGQSQSALVRAGLYCVDFRGMTQTNTKTLYTRSVRRKDR